MCRKLKQRIFTCQRNIHSLVDCNLNRGRGSLHVSDSEKYISKQDV